jgi:archaellum biogenesis ATPase FlaH
MNNKTESTNRDTRTTSATETSNWFEMLDLEPLTAAADDEEMRWLSPGRILAGRISLLAASPKTGKSMLGMALAIGAASGKDVLPLMNGTPFFPFPKPAKTLYIDTENTTASCRKRMRGIASAMSADLESLLAKGGNLEYMCGGNSTKMSTLFDENQLANALKSCGTELLIVDTFSDTYPAKANRSFDENSQGDMQSHLQSFRMLANEGVGILLVHHLNKTKSAPPGSSPFDKVAGSSQLFRKVHSVYLLESTRHPNLLRLYYTGNDMPDAGERYIQSVQTGDGLALQFMETSKPTRSPRKHGPGQRSETNSIKGFLEKSQLASLSDWTKKEWCKMVMKHGRSSKTASTWLTNALSSGLIMKAGPTGQYRVSPPQST